MEPFAYSLFASFLNKLDSFVIKVFPAFMDAFGNWARAFFVLYIVIVGILVMMGKMGDKTKSFVISLFLLPALWVLIMETRLYYTWVVDLTTDLTLDIASFFINVLKDDFMGYGAGLEAMFAGLDELSFKIFDLMVKIDPPGSFITNAWVYAQTGILALVLLAVYCAAYVAFLVMVIMGFFAMYVLFTVGGVCIFFAAFQQTRFIFFAWFKSLLNYMLLVIFASIIMSICFFGLDAAISKLLSLKTANILFSPEYLGAVCWSALTLAMLLKAPDYASALSGGMAGSSSGIAGGIAMAAGAGVMAMGKMAKGGMPLANSAARGVQGIQAGANRAYSRMMGIED